MAGQLWLAAGALALLYWVCKAVYRLTFHPLARFPGPKLAAITRLYGAYYDLSPTRSYVKELPALHDKYGPIVRAWPNVLHIRDMDSYNQIYRPGTKFLKQYKESPNSYPRSVLDHMFFDIPDPKEAKHRKDLYQPFFSKAAVQRLEYLIQEKIDKFLSKLSSAAKAGTVVDLSLGFSCLTSDVIMQYCYDTPFGALDAPEFKFPMTMAIEENTELLQHMQYFSGFFRGVANLLQHLPHEWSGGLGASLMIRKNCYKRVDELIERKDTENTVPTMFDIAIKPNQEKNQYVSSREELGDDAFLMFIAGTDTTATTLVQGTWKAMANPSIYQKLRAELLEHMPSKDSKVPASSLEKLPYLRGFVRESLRLAYGVPGRLTRQVPETGAVFCGQNIPPGTAVAHSAYVYHTDESMFKDANSFKPERWLGDDFNELDNRMLSFSRGSRGCLGINLAYATLYLTVSQLVRKFELTPFDTTAETMVWKDCFMPKTKGHLRVTVKEIAD